MESREQIVTCDKSFLRPRTSQVNQIHGSLFTCMTGRCIEVPPQFSMQLQKVGLTPQRWETGYRNCYRTKYRYEEVPIRLCRSCAFCQPQSCTPSTPYYSYAICWWFVFHRCQEFAFYDQYLLCEASKQYHSDKKIMSPRTHRIGLFTNRNHILLMGHCCQRYGHRQEVKTKSPTNGARKQFFAKKLRYC